MTIDEINHLHNIKAYSIFTDHAIYRYAHGIQTDTSRIHYPLCISDSLLDPKYRIYDYTEVSNALLNKSAFLTYSDVDNQFVVIKSHAKLYYIEDLSINQVQNIINNNIHLFAKINNRLQQDLLLSKLVEQ